MRRARISQVAPRVAYAAAAVVLFVVATNLTRRANVSWWYLGGFAVAPDLTMLIGVRRAGRGRISPNAVAWYNAAHRLLGPIALGAIVVWFSDAWLVGALAWAGHVCFDRAIGLRLRANDGSMRPRPRPETSATAAIDTPDTA